MVAASGARSAPVGHRPRAAGKSQGTETAVSPESRIAVIVIKCDAEIPMRPSLRVNGVMVVSP